MFWGLFLLFKVIFGRFLRIFEGFLVILRDSFPVLAHFSALFSQFLVDFFYGFLRIFKGFSAILRDSCPVLGPISALYSQFLVHFQGFSRIFLKDFRSF